MQNVHLHLHQMLRYSSDEYFLLILVFNDRSIPCVKNIRIETVLCKIQYRYRTVRYFAMYGTVPYRYCFMIRYEQMHLSLTWCGLLLLGYFLFLLHFSLAFLLPAVVGRCSHLAPVYHRCPYPTSDRPSSTHHPVIFSIDLCLNVFYITPRLLVAVPHEEVSKIRCTRGPCTRRAKPSSSPRPG
jgi:hypothetical protein